jgi:hypothetical protein
MQKIVSCSWENEQTLFSFHVFVSKIKQYFSENCSEMYQISSQALWAGEINLDILGFQNFFDLIFPGLLFHHTNHCFSPHIKPWTAIFVFGL